MDYQITAECGTLRRVDECFWTCSNSLTASLLLLLYYFLGALDVYMRQVIPRSVNYSWKVRSQVWLWSLMLFGVRFTPLVGSILLLLQQPSPNIQSHLESRAIRWHSV